jgi:hypothetical protein
MVLKRELSTHRHVSSILGLFQRASSETKIKITKQKALESREKKRSLPIVGLKYNLKSISFI